MSSEKNRAVAFVSVIVDYEESFAVFPFRAAGKVTATRADDTGCVVVKPSAVFEVGFGAIYGFVALPFMSITSTTPASSSMPGIFMRVLSFEPGILYGPYLSSTRVDLGFAAERKRGSIVVILGGGAGFMSMSIGISTVVSLCSGQNVRSTYEAGHLLWLQAQQCMMQKKFSSLDAVKANATVNLEW
ncbi:hypothetical protein E6O75_ATG07102 [Venturia nashicola]|uniref:Uncharacterized protein n=1 Tax=Venturia nashicola TaxID=86259 RepID=A0A4Z1NV70_9PEZI|nr:hypothetical protein E6O75_ATG07102 [Venturia nashicola]